MLLIREMKDQNGLYLDYLECHDEHLSHANAFFFQKLRSLMIKHLPTVKELWIDRNYHGLVNVNDFGGCRVPKIICEAFIDDVWVDCVSGKRFDGPVDPPRFEDLQKDDEALYRFKNQMVSSWENRPLYEDKDAVRKIKRFIEQFESLILVYLPNCSMVKIAQNQEDCVASESYGHHNHIMLYKFNSRPCNCDNKTGKPHQLDRRVFV